ncbi:hypothetical protein [Pectobacterium brasiliense]|uniref:hypothetical protein n=1 Tax=Pectobacterium brasiliense TaxID=180957 RepID=UPI0019696E1A|nr:hypothetical protein [Pectobacterium brasiliense]MBN3262035.1 hypothetical protein [Pectobacterium brasiliense]
MNPSIASNTDKTSDYFYSSSSSNLFQEKSLTDEIILKKTNIMSSRYKEYDFRCMGELSWVEGESFSSLNGRVDFINQVVSNVKRDAPSKDIPVTFISLGSAGLLTEFFIHDQLKKSGYDNLTWRVIDTDYQDNGYHQCRKEFREKVNNNFKAFTTEQAYLSKKVGNNALAVDDRSRGVTVVLSIDPPTPLSDAADYFEAMSQTDMMGIRGMPIDDKCIEKANAIYLIPMEEDKFDPIKSQMFHSCVCLSGILKCTVDNNGRYTIKSTSDEQGDMLYNGIKPYMNAFKETSETMQKKN